LNGTRGLGVAAEELLPREVLRTFGNTAPFQFMPPHAGRACAKCHGRLGPEAKFCRSCGEAVNGHRRPRSEPLHENVVQMPQPDLDEIGEAPHPMLKLYDIDYLDTQLGLRAADIEPTLTPPAPAWRLRRHITPIPRLREVPAEDPDVPASAPAPAPAPAPRDPRPQQASDSTSVAVLAAVVFALIALGIAVLVHYFAPTSIPGYTAAEFGLKVQVRALEWLLGGILVAVVGLLLKR
jgi:hypothetical protein